MSILDRAYGLMGLTTRREAIRLRAVELAPEAPRTQAGWPVVTDKQFSRVYPDGCSEADVLRAMGLSA